MANPWLRLYSDFATDPKIQSLHETLQRRFIMLLCLKCNDDLDKLNEDELAFALRISSDELAETKQKFIDKGFIDESWMILNWGKRQYKSDNSTERSRRCREKQKQQDDCNDDATTMQRCSNGSASTPDTDTDTDIKNHVGVPPPCPHGKIIKIYHELLPELPSTRVDLWAGTTREKNLKQRWRESPKHQEEEFWKWFFSLVKTNSHWMGENDRRWKADLGWLVKKENFVKVIERGINNAK